MRRRPSGSGEDDNGSRSTSTAPERLDKSRDSSNARGRENAREVKLAMSRPQERKPSKDTNRTPVLEIHSHWDPTMEPKTELQNDVASSPVHTKGTPDITSENKRQRARMRNPWSCSTLTVATSICAIVLLTRPQRLRHVVYAPSLCSLF
jgi:glycosylphosphatidylinositol deacylase